MGSCVATIFNSVVIRRDVGASSDNIELVVRDVRADSDAITLVGIRLSEQLNALQRRTEASEQRRERERERDPHNRGQ